MADVSLPGVQESELLAINQCGRAVGYELGTSRYSATIRENRVTTPITALLPGTDNSKAIYVNDAGTVVGTCWTYYDVAYSYQNGVMTEISLGGGYSQPTHLNETGHVVGAGATPFGSEHAFLYFNGVTTDLGTLGGWQSRAQYVNTLGHVVGTSLDEFGQERSFVYRDGAMSQIPDFGFGASRAREINDAGLVIGQAFSGIDDASFLWDPATGLRNIRPDGFQVDNVYAGAHDLNSRGQVVGVIGGFQNGRLVQRAFVYDHSIGFKRFVDMGGSEASLWAVNEAGQACGDAVDGVQAFVTAPTIVNTAPTASAGADQSVVATGTATPVTILGSGSDAEGAITYRWALNGQIVGSSAQLDTTLSPGSHTLTLTTTDEGGLTATDEVSVSVLYSWSGFHAPIGRGNAFKSGGTVPVKFALTGASAPVTNATATLLINGSAAGMFAYANGQYQCNWSTKGRSPGSYVIAVDLGDGVPRQTTVVLK